MTANWCNFGYEFIDYAIRRGYTPLKETKEVIVLIDIDIDIHLTSKGIVWATEKFNVCKCMGNRGSDAIYKADISPRA